MNPIVQVFFSQGAVWIAADFRTSTLAEDKLPGHIISSDKIRLNSRIVIGGTQAAQGDFLEA